MKKILLLLFLFHFEICNAQQWFPLQGGLSGNDAQNNKVVSMCADTINHVLYVGGYFNQCDADTGIISVNNLARWDGTNWSQVLVHQGSTMGTGFGKVITAMVLKGTEIVLTISNDADNIYAIVKFNINTLDFSTLGYFNNSLNTLCVYKDTVYVGGKFTQWKPNAASAWQGGSGVLKWMGINNQWLQVGGGISVGGFSEINALCVHHNKLYAAGIFENAGGTYCKNIAYWNDTSWSAVGNGIGFSGQFDCILHALVSYKNKLYTGGDFYMSDGYFANGLGMWNDTTWSATGVNATAVYALKVHGNKLYFGSDGSSLGTWLWDRVTCYDDSVWVSTGIGPTGDVLALEVFNNDLYAGGVFETIDSITNAGFIARYDPTIIQDTTTIFEVKQKDSAINIYPNPATTEIKISNLSLEENQIKIFNLLGQQVKILSMSNQQNHTINISDLPSGIYMLTVSNNKKISCKKFVKE